MNFIIEHYIKTCYNTCMNYLEVHRQQIWCYNLSLNMSKNKHLEGLQNVIDIFWIGSVLFYRDCI